ncbi:hypothetical protein PENSUB_6568 [Penicillium subrubescens]|uniref:Uncharacterized protein n=1 Tax=Penicillium subrubescens TaxID=1316194 RepID=A0A1Q5U048_9EURO|nr:hypothetical protein PENSUB_6568 [Penicillium subrubescens]
MVTLDIYRTSKDRQSRGRLIDGSNYYCIAFPTPVELREQIFRFARFVNSYS